MVQAHAVHGYRYFFLCLVFIMLTACGGGDSQSDSPGSSNDPADIANDYLDEQGIDLSSTSGTTYEGDYLPFNQGNTWYYEGSGVVSVDETITMNIPGEVPETETMPTATDSFLLSAWWEIQAPEMMELGGESVTVYPMEENTEHYMFEGASPETLPDIKRYFEEKDGNVYIRAIQIDSGEVINVENPMFLKSTLTVGDAWTTEPLINLDDYLTEDYFDTHALDSFGMTMEINFVDPVIRSTMVVIGEETIDVNGDDIDAVRVDQIIDAELSGSGSSAGLYQGVSIRADFTVIMSLDAAIKLFFQEGVGIVKDDETLDLDIQLQITLYALGDKATMMITMHVTSEGNIVLSNAELTEGDAEAIDSFEMSAARMGAATNDAAESGESKAFSTDSCLKTMFQQIEANMDAIMDRMVENMHVN